MSCNALVYNEPGDEISLMALEIAKRGTDACVLRSGNKFDVVWSFSKATCWYLLGTMISFYILKATCTFLPGIYTYAGRILSTW